MYIIKWGWQIIGQQLAWSDLTFICIHEQILKDQNRLKLKS